MNIEQNVVALGTTGWAKNGRPLSMEEISAAWTKAWPQIIAKAWVDSEFHKKLMTSPKEVFEEYGLPMLPNMHYVMREGTSPTTMTFFVPPKPADLGEEKLEDVLKEVVTTYRHHCGGGSCTF
jgi:hypothetical protein